MASVDPESQASPLRHKMPGSRQDLTRQGYPAHMPPVQLSKQLFPYCVVWSPLPPITWLLPFIGHMGIANSRGRAFYIYLSTLPHNQTICTYLHLVPSGIIHDFAGPYTIGVGNFAFGAPTRYMLLQPDQCFGTTWDEGVDSGCVEYGKRMHNLCCDNCHSHVARCLNDMRYKNSTSWNMLKLGVMMFFFGKFTDTWGAVKTFAPFLAFLFTTLYFTGQI